MATKKPPLTPTRKPHPAWHNTAGHIAIAAGLLVGVGLASYSAGRWAILQRIGHEVLTRTHRSTQLAAKPTIYDDVLKLEFDVEQLRREAVEQGVVVPGITTSIDAATKSKRYFAIGQPVEGMWLLATVRTSRDNDARSLAFAETVRHQQTAERATTSAAPQAAQPAQPAQAQSTYLPILLYHKNPPDFEAQLLQLKNRGYTTITMAQAACGIAKTCTLPAKPAVITFDDGFSDQLKAFGLLQKYQMRATYYLIIGGERSHHCIGIERIPAPCGDSYLNWSEVKQLAASPLIEIGAHTVDHLALASLDATNQEFQIVTSKQRLEQELGIKITTLAYPYGSFNGLSVQIAQRAGFSNAVSTLSGSEQSPTSLYSLHRIRDTYNLP